MVIRKAEDMLKLLKERVEMMEDLNCEDLHECVEAFMVLAMALMRMKDLKEAGSITIEDSEFATVLDIPQLREVFRKYFSESKGIAEEALNTIDRLTLRTDTAE